MPSKLEYQETVSSFQHVEAPPHPMLDQVQVVLHLIFYYLKSFAGQIYNLNGNWNAWIFIVVHIILISNRKKLQIFVNPNCMNAAIHTIGHVPCLTQLPSITTVSPLSSVHIQTKKDCFMSSGTEWRQKSSRPLSLHTWTTTTTYMWPRRLKNIHTYDDDAMYA